MVSYNVVAFGNQYMGLCQEEWRRINTLLQMNVKLGLFQ